MVASFATQTITRVRPGTKTLRGSEVPDWSNTTSVSISGCSVQPATATLSQDGRVLGISDGWTAYLPTGADVKAGDKIVFDGNEYAINGEPRTWISPTGNRSNMQLNLMRWSG